MAVPRESIPTWGRTHGWEHAIWVRSDHPRPGTNRLPRMSYCSASCGPHTTPASPPGLLATCGGPAVPGREVSMSRGVPHPPPTVYWFSQTVHRVPLYPSHATTAFPFASTATCGESACRGFASIIVGAAHPTERGNVQRAAQILLLTPPSYSYQAM